MEHDLVVDLDGRKIEEFSEPQADKICPLVAKLQRIVLPIKTIAIDSIRPEANS